MDLNLPGSLLHRSIVCSFEPCPLPDYVTLLYSRTYQAAERNLRLVRVHLLTVRGDEELYLRYYTLGSDGI